MTQLAREAVDRFREEMKRKQAEAYRAGTALADWFAYETERDAEASAAAKLNADLTDANTPV